jgi:hypothetical protein
MEERTRYFKRNGEFYKILIAWHYIDPVKKPGVKYHYIHVYKNGRDIPFRSLRWAEMTDGSWRWV